MHENRINKRYSEAKGEVGQRQLKLALPVLCFYSIPTNAGLWVRFQVRECSRRYAHDAGVRVTI
jgi:hypothetical protein